VKGVKVNISPNEAEEALATIQEVTRKTRHSIASSGAHFSLIVTGIVWLVGFLCTQFLSGAILVSIWVGLSVVGGIVASLLGMRRSKQVRSVSAGMTARRLAVIWLLLVVYCGAAIAVAWPLNGIQMTFLIVLFVMIGWMIMGVELSFSPVWPGLVVIVLMLLGYFLIPGYFYLWMGILGGGGMIALGLYIRSRW
jgi:hypothetical protein